ncbi:energy-coupling factor transporter transmembrane protein EcfT, partial [Megasphaera massiliensis]|uniref:energy-coupling factor transporter transmembrane protein EcfT n=1 Tax=Megasphaera massiliensis TaxID=1232428 RepID=UPI001D079C56
TSVGAATESSTNAGKAGIESIEDESRNRPSFVASLDPRAKMVTFLTLMFTAFVITRPAQLAMGAVLTACVVAAARLHPLRLLSS